MLLFFRCFEKKEILVRRPLFVPLPSLRTTVAQNCLIFSSSWRLFFTLSHTHKQTRIQRELLFDQLAARYHHDPRTLLRNTAATAAGGAAAAGAFATSSNTNTTTTASTANGSSVTGTVAATARKGGWMKKASPLACKRMLISI